MDAQKAILAGALLNAELMEQRDEARAVAAQWMERAQKAEAAAKEAGVEVPDAAPATPARTPGRRSAPK